MFNAKHHGIGTTFLHLLLFCTLVLGHLSASAAGLSGRVMDEGEPVTQAHVTLMSAENNIVVDKSTTNDKGEYRFSVSAGTYKLMSLKEEYATTWVKDISVSDADVSVDIQLTPEVFVENGKNTNSGDCD